MWQAIILLSSAAVFFVLFHIESLLDSKYGITLQFSVLCGVVVFLYQKSMVHCVVCCRQVHKSGSRDLSYLVVIFYVFESESTVDLYMTFQGESRPVP